MYRTFLYSHLLAALVLDNIAPFVLFLAVHNSPEPGLDLRRVSCALNTGLQHVHINITIPDQFHGSNEVLIS